MAKARRVFEIAKELGVTSKAIVQKCQDEDVPGITNHMSTVKVGLAQTIQEWFSEDHAVTTAVESAAQVDLTTVRRARRRMSEVAEAVSEAPTVSEAPDVSEEPAVLEEPAVSEAPAVSEEPVVTDESVVTGEPAVTGDASSETVPTDTTATESETPVETHTAPAPADIAATSSVTSTPEASDQVATEVPSTEQQEPDPITQAVGRPNVPDRPQAIKPAGERLEKPKAVALKGPEVVRIEKPDRLQPPRPSRPAQPKRESANTDAGREPLAPSGARSRGSRGGQGPPTRSDGEGQNRRHRSLTTRRGRYAESFPSGPTKFSEVDQAEQDARLNRAAGFLKQRRRDLKNREVAAAQTTSTPAIDGGKVEIAEPIFIKDLSAATGLKSADILKSLFTKGVMVNINSAIGSEAAMEVCLEYNIELEVKEQQTMEEQVVEAFQQREAIDVGPRPPTVTVLGHVDHGKTTLLDRIRDSDVVDHEAGGITQHIGAYRVSITGTDGQEKTAVFLDTPGHEAFTSMRARGANMTDLVVLVVAADDGVMPQTIESINHAKAAEAPIIVALNKIDRPEANEANIRKIYGQLAEHGLNPAEWGGDTEVIKVSATEGTGVTDLLEILDYQAELLELTADFGGPAQGAVVEAEMQPGRGPVARIVVQQGQLRVGDFIVTGRAYGRVRDMSDDHGRAIEQAGPATPLELSGIDTIPDAGERFYVTDTLQMAEQIAQQARERDRTRQLANQTKVTLDNFTDQLKAGKTKELRVVLKADVQGSIGVLRKSLEDMGNQEVTVRVLHNGVGGVTESDVLLADASDALIIGFHVVAPPPVRELAEQRQIQIKLYRVIYEVIDDVKAALEGMLAPERREEVIGEAEVRQVFRISKMGMVAGCLVVEGTIQHQATVRVTRDDVVVTEDRKIESLRRVKDEVTEVRQGTECGLHLAGFDDVKPGDRLVCYRTTEVRRTLE